VLFEGLLVNEASIHTAAAASQSVSFSTAAAGPSARVILLRLLVLLGCSLFLVGGVLVRMNVKVPQPWTPLCLPYNTTNTSSFTVELPYQTLQSAYYSDVGMSGFDFVSEGTVLPPVENVTLPWCKNSTKSVYEDTHWSSEMPHWASPYSRVWS